MLKSYDKMLEAIKKEILHICWFMRGGITYDQAMMLSYQERKLISSIIEENLEITKKTKLPYF